jgi:hypothetical protein
MILALLTPGNQLPLGDDGAVKPTQAHDLFFVEGR